MSWNDRTSIVLDASEEACARYLKRAGPIDYAAALCGALRRAKWALESQNASNRDARRIPVIGASRANGLQSARL
jgi:hypothetical protein